MHHQIGLQVLILLVALVLPYAISMGSIKAVSVFRTDEVLYHKYSAVLAAAEPFRLQLENDIQNAMSPIAYCIRRLKGRSAPL
jgi:hypothetical protein